MTNGNPHSQHTIPMWSAALVLLLMRYSFAQSGGDYVITKSTIDGGGGKVVGAPYVLSGTVGQHDAARHAGGAYRLTGGFWSPRCPIAEPPEIVQWDSNSGAGTSLVDLKMNRYLGIRAPAGGAGRQQAIRVEFRTLPAPFDIWNGRKLWVTDPVQRCETSGSDSTTTCAHPFFPQANLSCSPFYRDWTTVPGGTVYVTHPGLVPSRYNGAVLSEAAEYEIRMIDIACDADVLDNYSAATQVLQTKYGDMAGPFDPSGPYYTAAEGNNIGVGTDVTAILNKFANRPGAPIKPRADLEPCQLDSKINISDVTLALNGFRGLNYPFAPGTGNCANLDPCTYGPALEAATLR